MSKNRRQFGLVGLCWLFMQSIYLPHVVAAETSSIRLATTTSAVSSGLMKELVTAFEHDTHYKIEVIAVGSGNALRRARTGKADLTITHSPIAELKFVEEGFGIEKKLLMSNEIVLVGPKTDPADIRNTNDFSTAFKQIATKQAKFVSRGDDSGTHKKELSIWGQLGIEPYGDWYIESGTGQSDALKIAGNEQAYIVTDKGTWLALGGTSNLRLFLTSDAQLANRYYVMLTNPDKVVSVNAKGARAFRDWLLSSSGQKIVSSLRVGNEHLFHPANYVFP